MGRTLPTQIQLLHEAEAEWKYFRRALRKEDQEAFDVVWSYARRHSMACSMASRPLPFEAHVLAMVVALQRELDNLRSVIPAKAGIQDVKINKREEKRLDPGFRRGDDNNSRKKDHEKGA